MNPEPTEMFSVDEKDILQEIMNIAFGNATADLAEVIDIYVQLSVPEIQILYIKELSDFLKNALKNTAATSIIEQKFQGEFKGSGLLVFPEKAGRCLVSILDNNKDSSPENASTAALEKGALLEVGNILIGACVGKITELLNTFATYLPPQILQEKFNEDTFLAEFYDPMQTAIVMKTVFTFKQEDVDGLLLLLTNHESIGWLKKALNKFIESYE
jgi:chemotaxis protein CheC